MTGRVDAKRRARDAVVTRAIAATLAFLAFLGCVSPSHAWWDESHAIIAAVATERLTPTAAAAVARLLEDDPTGHTLVSVSAWADTVRKTPMPETYNWHFVDIPVDADPPTYVAARDCKPAAGGDCIVAALEREAAVLKDPQAPPRTRAEALKFLTHLVGDLHQPLHCAERNSDAGGNAVPVIFFGATQQPPPYQAKPWNLHAVWDGGLIDRTGRDRSSYVQHLREWIAAHDATSIEAGTFADWANETHGQAVHHAYRSANGRDPFPASGGRIAARYQQANIAVVDEQLAKAAVRLAKVLNDALSTQ